MKSKKSFLWLAFLIIATVWILIKRNDTAPYNKINGLIFGTVYDITYQYDGDLKQEITAKLNQFDGSLSMFNDTSTISLINQNKEVKIDSFFKKCFNRSMQISQETDGAFDITVAPLVNAWGFGFKHETFPDSAVIDSLRQIIGYKKIKLVDGKIIKQDPRIKLDCSAVAKGYSVDVIADLLKEKGIKNYMIDIGGELVTSGKNPQNKLWRIGINKPIDDSLSINEEIQTILKLSNVALATSGNYRNFYYKGGRKFAHTIDPKTGYPVQHNILSSTVVAKDCMTADALATSFMVMGLDKAKIFIKKHPEINTYFIYTDKNNKYATYFTKGMKKYMKEGN